MNNLNTTHCLECGDELPGRIGQKFCSIYCKSSYHYKISKTKESRRYDRVLTQLKLNRRILKLYNLSGQSQVKESVLIKEGFDFEFYTGTWTAKNGNLYYFCFEYGYRNLNDGKYMLITWQKYMEKKNISKK